MQVIRDILKSTDSMRSVVTIGAYDGVHRGHQAVIAQVKATAQQLGCRSVVITFDRRYFGGTTGATSNPCGGRSCDQRPGPAGQWRLGRGIADLLAPRNLDAGFQPGAEWPHRRLL